MIKFEDVKTEVKRIGMSFKDSFKEYSQPLIDWASENKKWLIAIGISSIIQRVYGYYCGWNNGYDFCHDKDDDRINTIRAMAFCDYGAKEDSEAMAEICNAIDQIGAIETLNIINGEDNY